MTLLLGMTRSDYATIMSFKRPINDVDCKTERIKCTRLLQYVYEADMGTNSYEFRFVAFRGVFG